MGVERLARCPRLGSLACQYIEYVFTTGSPGGQCRLDGHLDPLHVVLGYAGQSMGHHPLVAAVAQQVLLELFKCLKVSEWGNIVHDSTDRQQQPADVSRTSPFVDATHYFTAP